jgi:cob(I)alamin adenosyltransferase
MKPRILIFTGDGKGKTTAATGMMLRELGHGGTALLVQFMKADIGSGEITALRTFAPRCEIDIVGLGFVPPPTHPAFSRHRDAALKGLDIARQRLKESAFRLIVLDEICGAIAHDLVATADVVALLASLRDNQVIVLTGRNAPPELIACADTVSEIRCLKHGYDQGVPAQKGVEF